jgi:hypothetical protein
MMLRFFLCLTLLAGLCAGFAQPAGKDSLARAHPKRLQVGALVDAYWGYHSSRPASGEVAHFVSSARHNQLNVNLAYADIRYEGSRVRVRIVPATGTFMRANYAHEPEALRHWLEANVGVRLHRHKKIWLDAGVMGSPYTNETPLSKDHIMYTRSFAPEYVPYYLSGVRLSVPLNKKWSSQWYVLTGWQLIRDNNQAKALGSLISFRPNAQMAFNWSTFAGDERSALNPDFRLRLFSDVYWVYKPAGRWDASACVYAGSQQIAAGPARTWWQANAMARYALTSGLSVSGRVEYFHDAFLAVARRVFPDRAFTVWSGSLGVSQKLHERALLRAECRRFYSPDDALPDAEGLPAPHASWLVVSLAAWL